MLTQRQRKLWKELSGNNLPIGRFGGILALLLFSPLLGVVQSGIPDPDDPPPWLEYWTFDNTNTWITSKGYLPVGFTNVGVSDLGEWYAPILDSTNAAWLHYNVTESGTNHLKVDFGSVMFWFAPNWSSTNTGGTGPGEWSRLIEVGAYTTNASYGWWSIYTDPDGVNLYFAAQTNNGSGATYLSVPISWNVTNLWHHLALTYSATNTAFYLDGEFVTNGSPVAYWPGPDILTNGFFIGSDSNGLSQAHGIFDELFTYDYPVNADTVFGTYWYSGIWYYGNPMNAANIASAPSQPTSTPYFNAVTGTGYLIQLTNSAPCTTNSNVWMTNMVVSMASNGTMNVSFAIAGGTEGLLYDVFANSALDFSNTTNRPWAWTGQGYHCATYLLTNLPATSAFLILGQPTDSDADGLTDAMELLVYKTNPHLSDTLGDGMLDGWKIVWGLNPLIDNTAQTSKRSNYIYDTAGWLRQLTGNRAESLILDREGNVQQSK